MDPIRLMIVDDHEIVREGLSTLLADERRVDVVAEARDADEALRLLPRFDPQVVLMDLKLPGTNGIDATRELRRRHPRVQVIVLTGSFGDELRVQDAIEAGAVGYMLKDVSKHELVRAIQRAADGKATLHPEAQEQLLHAATRPPPPHADLTPREMDVLKLLALGMSNKKIARELDLTEGTVKGYVSIVFGKLGVKDRTQAALYAVREGIVEEGRG